MPKNPTSRKLRIVAGYFLAVVVADFVTVLLAFIFLGEVGTWSNLFVGTMLAGLPLSLSFGFVYIVIFATIPAMTFILWLARYFRARWYAYAIAGACVALIALSIALLFKALPYPGEVWLFVTPFCLFGGAVGAVAYWKVAVVPMLKSENEQIQDT